MFVHTYWHARRGTSYQHSDHVLERQTFKLFITYREVYNIEQLQYFTEITPNFPQTQSQVSDLEKVSKQLNLFCLVYPL